MWARPGVSFAALMLALLASSSVFAYWRWQLEDEATLAVSLVMFAVCGLILVGINLFCQFHGERGCWSVRVANAAYLGLTLVALAVSLLV